MHKKENSIKYTSSNKEYDIAIYQMYRMGCPICERRIGKGFKELKRYYTCDVNNFRQDRNWKKYRKNQYKN